MSNGVVVRSGAVESSSEQCCRSQEWSNREQYQIWVVINIGTGEISTEQWSGAVDDGSEHGSVYQEWGSRKKLQTE